MRLLASIILFASSALYAGESLRVMSFNVRYGTAKDGENHWDKRKELCASRVTVFNPDLLGLQEALGFQNVFILGTLEGFAQLGVAREDGKEKGEHTTVMYRKARFELVASGTFWLSETPDEPGSKSWDSSLPRIATWARLKDLKNGGAELLFLNTHFDHKGNQARVEAAKVIKKFVAEKGKDLPVIITGDFNSAPGSPQYKTLVDKDDSKPEYQDSYVVVFKDKPELVEGTAHAFQEKPVTSRIDWILCSPHYSVEDAAIDRYHEGVLFPSDHFAVNAVLKLK